MEHVLALAAAEFPDSVVADLMMYFEPTVIIKFIEIFSGRTITVPRIDKIWASYVTYMVEQELGDRDGSVIRESLAGFLGITPEEVALIAGRKRQRRKARMSERKLRETIDIVGNHAISETTKDLTVDRDNYRTKR
jgi:hypothetical protein